MPAPLTTRVPTGNWLVPGPAATTPPGNSWPSTTGGRASSGACAPRLQRVPGRDDRGRVDDAAGQEPDRLRPDARRPDDALDAERPRLDEPKLGRDLAADVNADIDDPAVDRRDRQRLRHRLR